ncbi:hypothetical protein [Kitasatospora sp. NPDC056184]|uniref:hypothetical protein n=1 Tax=Kitasatospora sp. NPDC056184 TaxID=3345738 RepID=UPI0035DAC6BE
MTARLAPSAALAVSLTASAALLPVLAVLGELRPTWLAFTAYAALCAAVGRRSRPSAAPLIGLAAWLFHNGFVENHHGTLTASAPEALHLLLLAAAALAPALLPGRPGTGSPRTGRTPYDLAA